VRSHGALRAAGSGGERQRISVGFRAPRGPTRRRSPRSMSRPLLPVAARPPPQDRAFPITRPRFGDGAARSRLTCLREVARDALGLVTIANSFMRPRTSASTEHRRRTCVREAPPKSVGRPPRGFGSSSAVLLAVSAAAAARCAAPSASGGEHAGVLHGGDGEGVAQTSTSNAST